MRLIVQAIDPNTADTEYEIGEGKEYKTWYWGQAVTIAGPCAYNLVIKAWCHPGCRIEIPREQISSIKIETNAHHGEEITHADIRALANKYDEITKS